MSYPLSATLTAAVLTGSGVKPEARYTCPAPSLEAPSQSNVSPATFALNGAAIPTAIRPEG